MVHLAYRLWWRAGIHSIWYSRDLIDTGPSRSARYGGRPDHSIQGERMFSAGDRCPCSRLGPLLWHQAPGQLSYRAEFLTSSSRARWPRPLSRAHPLHIHGAPLAHPPRATMQEYEVRSVHAAGGPRIYGAARTGIRGGAEALLRGARCRSGAGQAEATCGHRAVMGRGGEEQAWWRAPPHHRLIPPPQQAGGWPPASPLNLKLENGAPHPRNHRTSTQGARQHLGPSDPPSSLSQFWRLPHLLQLQWRAAPPDLL
jgi:hypothetical protein